LDLLYDNSGRKKKEEEKEAEIKDETVVSYNLRRVPYRFCSDLLYNRDGRRKRGRERRGNQERGRLLLLHICSFMSHSFPFIDGVTSREL